MIFEESENDDLFKLNLNPALKKDSQNAKSGSEKLKRFIKGIILKFSQVNCSKKKYTDI